MPPIIDAAIRLITSEPAPEKSAETPAVAMNPTPLATDWLNPSR